MSRSYYSNVRNVNAALSKNIALSALSQTGLLPMLLDETTQAVVVLSFFIFSSSTIVPTLTSMPFFSSEIVSPSTC